MVIASWTVGAMLLAHGPRRRVRQSLWGATLGLASGVVGTASLCCLCVLRRFDCSYEVDCSPAIALCTVWILGPAGGAILTLVQHTVPVHDTARLDARDAVLARGGALLVGAAALGVVLAASVEIALVQSTMALIGAAAIGIALDHDWGRWRRLGRLEHGIDHGFAMRAIEPHEHAELPRWVGATDDAAPTLVEQRALGDGGPFRETTIATPRFRLPGGVLHARDVIARRTAFSGAAIALATAILLAGARCN